jgi:CBS domain-containing protein
MNIGTMISPNQYFTLDSSWSVAEVYRFFISVGEDVFCVEKDGKYLGLVTRDKVTQMVKSCVELAKLERTPVGAIIADSQASSVEDQPVTDVLSLMRRDNHRYLPVRRGNAVIGLVSRDTLANVARYCDTY